MDVTWGWQHVDFSPGERREQGLITEDQALVTYANFPWQAQLEQVAVRQRTGLSSVWPGLWFRRGDEILLLTSPDEWTVVLDFRVGEQQYFYELSLSWWAHNLDPEDLIQLFFAGTLAQWPGWQFPDRFATFSPSLSS